MPATITPTKIYAEIERRTPKVTDALLADITERIVRHFDPEQVILFGSYAYGTPHKDSDVDLFVIMEGEGDLFSRIHRVSQVAQVDYLPMDVLTRTPREVQERLDMGDYFMAEVLERGKVLYKRGDVARRMD